MYYISGQEANVYEILVRDTVSTWEENDGYTLCGPRIYTITERSG